MSEYALNIETISPTKFPSEPDHFLESEYFEIFTISVAEKKDENINKKVFFRKSLSPEDEWNLIKQSIEWLSDRMMNNSDSDIIYTYNGDAFDFVHLRGRSKLLENQLEKQGLVGDVRNVLSLTRHIDLHNEAWKKYGDYTTLHDVCEKLNIDVEHVFIDDFKHGMDKTAWRDPSDVDCKKVLNEDIPIMGEQYLSYKQKENKSNTEQEYTNELYNLLYTYSLSDVESLFKMSEKLLNR